jgi:hypothetical protein
MHPEMREKLFSPGHGPFSGDEINHARLADVCAQSGGHRQISIALLAFSLC